MMALFHHLRDGGGHGLLDSRQLKHNLIAFGRQRIKILYIFHMFDKGQIERMSIPSHPLNLLVEFFDNNPFQVMIIEQWATLHMASDGLSTPDFFSKFNV